MQYYSTVGSNRIAEAVEFYDALLGQAGWQMLFDHPRGGRVYGNGQGMFGVLKPIDEKPATAGNGAMVGFAMTDRAAVDSFHARAIALGATDEGAPGFRGPEEMGAYFSYFRDLDGNKLCAFNYAPAAG